MKKEQFIVEMRAYIAINFVTQCKYAEKLGVSNTFVGMVVNGKKNPNPQILNDLGLTMNKETVVTFHRVNKKALKNEKQ